MAFEREWYRKRSQEIAGVLLLLLSVLLLLSLLTYSPTDPSLDASGEGSSAPIHNRAGLFGAYISDLVLQLFGLGSFLVPLLAIGVALRLVLHRGLTHVPSRLVSGTVLIGLASVLLFLLAPPWFRFENMTSGGVLGELVGRFLLLKIGLQGSLLTCGAVLLIAALFLTRLSFAELCRSIASAVAGFFGRIFGSITARFRKAHQQRERKQLRKEVLAKHAAKLAEPPAEFPLGGPAAEAAARAASRAKTVPAHGSSQEQLPLPDVAPPQRPPSRFKSPSITLLDNPPRDNAVNEEELQERARMIESKLGEFGIEGEVTAMHPGPVITVYEFFPNAGVKFSRVQGMADDLSMALKAESVRIDKIPGRSTVGLEVPNDKRSVIFLREILSSAAFQHHQSPITLALGKDSGGNPFVADLAKMPHLLIAGATGMGKSVSLHSMICSLLYKATPEEVRLILIDPKRVELGVYADIPHLYCEVIVEPKKAVTALKNARAEMERRYRSLADIRARNIEHYNHKLRRGDYEHPPGKEAPKILPYLVIVIDELADLMAEMSGEVEHQIGRLAQMARAVGIHLILATQRPSVDVITGTIKNNLPARISFKVTQKIDSRTILDTTGADQLLGNGDMLFLAPGTSRLVRVHGAFVSEEEVMRVVTHLRREGKPDYNQAFLKEEEKDEVGSGGEVQDELFRQAVELVLSSGQASASHLQRRLKLGYNRAARLIDLMEEKGILGPASGPNKSREILVKPDYLDKLGANPPAGD